MVRKMIFPVMMVVQLLSGCTANSYHRIVGTVGEIHAKPEVWEVQVFDNDGNLHRINIPIQAVGQAGYDGHELEQKIYSGKRIDVVTGPRKVVRRLALSEDRTVLTLLAPLEVPLAEERDSAP